jgi:dATP/dGTP diphosphohydrolase
MAEGMKWDKGKCRMDLIPISTLRGIGDVLGYGAEIKGYGERNWERGLEWNRTYAAALRHLTSWWDGEDNDPESGLSHLSHAATNIAFLVEFLRTHPELDTRPNRVTKDDRDIQLARRYAAAGTPSRAGDSRDGLADATGWPGNA